MKYVSLKMGIIILFGLNSFAFPSEWDFEVQNMQYINTAPEEWNLYSKKLT
jgi:hypothetical protein